MYKHGTTGFGISSKISSWWYINCPFWPRSYIQQKLVAWQGIAEHNMYPTTQNGNFSIVYALVPDQAVADQPPKSIISG